MSALQTNRNTIEKLSVEFNPVVKSGSTVHKGAIVGMNTSGTIQPMAASVSGGLVALGRAEQSVVGDGVKTCRVKPGIFKVANSASSDEIGALQINQAVFAADDQTAAKTDGTATRSVMGKCLGVDAADGQVIVDVGPLGMPDGDVVAANNLSDLANASTARGNLAVSDSFTFLVSDLVGANAQRMGFVAPKACTITKIYSVLAGHALAAGNATLTAKIAGVAVTNGVVTITQSGSAIGDVDVATPSAANTATAGQFVEVLVGGTNTDTDAQAVVTVLVTY